MPQLTPYPETQLQADVEGRLKLLGWRWYHTRDSRRSNAGFPDIVAIRGQRLLFIELKGIDAQGRLGTVTKEQEAWHKDLSEIPSVEMYVWGPQHWDNNTIERMLA